MLVDVSWKSFETNKQMWPKFETTFFLSPNSKLQTVQTKNDQRFFNAKRFRQLG